MSLNVRLDKIENSISSNKINSRGFPDFEFKEGTSLKTCPRK
jgi:hypothetical protein